MFSQDLQKYFYSKFIQAWLCEVSVLGISDSHYENFNNKSNWMFHSDQEDIILLKTLEEESLENLEKVQEEVLNTVCSIILGKVSVPYLSLFSDKSLDKCYASKREILGIAPSVLESWRARDNFLSWESIFQIGVVKEEAFYRASVSILRYLLSDGSKIPPVRVTKDILLEVRKGARNGKVRLYEYCVGGAEISLSFTAGGIEVAKDFFLEEE